MEGLSKPDVAVAIPAFNEVEGISGFIREIDQALSPHVGTLRLMVVDDGSSDGTPAALDAIRSSLKGTLEVITNETNAGHGPTLLTAYRAALQCAPDFVLQVDGDGQFLGSDLRRVLVLLIDDAHAVCGVRRFRQDPWFRMSMTRMLRVYISAAYGVRARDANCPLRGYEAAVLQQLLPELPARSLIPNLLLTVLAASRGVPLVEVDVSHSVRRGASTQGSTWQARRWSPVPVRLLRFSVAALTESLAFRRSLQRGSGS